MVYPIIYNLWTTTKGHALLSYASHTCTVPVCCHLLLVLVLMSYVLVCCTPTFYSGAEEYEKRGVKSWIKKKKKKRKEKKDTKKKIASYLS